MSREPTIYLIPGCDTDDDLAELLHELCEEVLEEQLAGWYADTSTWPRNPSFDVFCHWFDYQHHSMLVDLSENRSPSSENVMCLTRSSFGESQGCALQSRTPACQSWSGNSRAGYYVTAKPEASQTRITAGLSDKN